MKFPIRAPPKYRDDKLKLFTSVCCHGDVPVAITLAVLTIWVVWICKDLGWLIAGLSRCLCSPPECDVTLRENAVWWLVCVCGSSLPWCAMLLPALSAFLLTPLLQAVHCEGSVPAARKEELSAWNLFYVLFYEKGFSEMDILNDFMVQCDGHCVFFSSFSIW